MVNIISSSYFRNLNNVKFIMMLLLGVFLSLNLHADQTVAEPVANYLERHKGDLRSENEKNEHVIQYKADVDGDGVDDFFVFREILSFRS